jgi:hypothetical protein
VRWMAPELFGAMVKKSRSSDVYAFAMTIIEVNISVFSFFTSLTQLGRGCDKQIYTGFHPFKGYINDFQVMSAVLINARPDRPSQLKMPDEMWSLVNRCWDGNKDFRPTMQKVLEEVSVFFRFHDVA